MSWALKLSEIFFGYNFGFQNSVNVSYCVGDFNARWNLPKEQFDIISEKVNNRVLKIDFLGWSKSFLFSSQNIFLYRVSQKNSKFFTSTLLRSFKKWYCECKVSKDHLSQDFNTIVFWMAKKERKKKVRVLLLSLMRGSFQRSMHLCIALHQQY